MKDYIKRLLFILCYFIAGFIFCTFIYLIQKENFQVIPPFKKAYIMSGIIIFFVQYIPVIQISAILVCYTIEFGKYSGYSFRKNSPFILKWVQKLFILCLVSSFFYVVFTEGITPGLVKRRKIFEQLTLRYFEYIEQAAGEIKKGSYLAASNYSDKALNIWKNSPEARGLKDKSEISLGRENKRSLNGNNLQKDFIVPENLTAAKSLLITESRMKMNDFYTANRYAAIAVKLSANNKELREKALELQKKCAEKIEQGLDAEAINKTQKEFDKKRKAYDAFTGGNYIKAYYSFLKIYNQTLDDNKYDPDIENLLKASKENLLKQIYFITELNEIPNFDFARNIKFDIVSKNESKRFQISGSCFMPNKNKNIIYLSDIIYSKYKYNGGLEFQIKIPYARFFEITDNEKTALTVQITGLSHDNEFETITPEPIAGMYYENIYKPIKLDMTMKDFDLIISAHKGAKSMTFYELYKFIRKAERFGFDKNIYYCELILRIADKILFLILSIAAVIISFYFRQPYKLKFKKQWVLFFPLFSYVSYIMIEILRQFIKLFLEFLVNVIPVFAIYIVVFVLLIIFIFLTFKLYNIRHS